jgi:hypothetical protein
MWERPELMAFDLWLEADYVDEELRDFCNVIVTLATGERYALNAWTFSFFEMTRSQAEEIANSTVLRGVD